MKKRLFLFSCFAVVFAFLLLNTLSAVPDELTSAKETDLPQVISDLLSGKNTDPQAALSNLEEKDFPLALTACEVLTHKALHQDIKVSPETLEAFKATLQKRLETSSAVSFHQTPTCVQKIPAREIVIEGKHLTVPEHYLAPVRFAIIGFSPTSEAGTILPDIGVAFVGGKPPIEAKILLDNKQIPAKQTKNSFVYQPISQPGSILKIGSHKVQAVLSDSEKQIASVSWSFSLGIKQTADITLPADANPISSFSIQVQELFPDSPVKGTIVVEEFQTSDGKRVLEYSVFNSDHPKTPLIKTQSLIWLRRLVEKGRQRPTITIKPGSPNAFPGNILNLSAKYDGPGFVADTLWRFSYGEPSDVSGAEISRPLGPTSLSITCFLTIKEVLPDGSVSQTTLTAFKTVEPLVPIISLSPTRRAQMSETGTGTMNIDSVRNLKNKELVEGAGFDIGEGHLTVVRSQIRLPYPTNEVTIENPAAKSTKLSFAAPAAVDVVNDVFLTYEWKDEKYTGEFSSGQNYNGYYAGDVALLGVFLASGTTRFKSLPPGIIRSTSRKVAIKEIEISIGGETRVFSPETGTDVNPSWVLARSALFPASAPLEIKGVSFRANLSDTITIPQTDPFQYLFKFDPNWGVPHEGYFKLQVSCRPSGQGFFWFPVSAWSTIFAFPENSALTQVMLSPANPAPIHEDQSISFSAAIGPQNGLGEGSFDSSGGELDILKGYKVTKVTSLEWKVVKGDSQTQEDTQWNFVFDPQKGPGTYTVSCQAILEAIEKETDSKVTLKGSGLCRPGVIPGLRIYSPIGSFSYPLGATIDVRTSFDGSFDDWKKIEWTLNGNPWQPDLQKPPLRLILNKTGDWSLTARMKTNDPDGHEVTLENTVNFVVFPTSITVSPTRKLTTLGSEPVNLELKVSLNNQPVKSTQESVDLPFYSGQVARIESVKWQLIPGPGVSASFKPSSNPFLGATTFSTAGAGTILGTATVRVSSSQTNPYQNNVSLTFPVRADAWAIETPDWGNTLSGRFPNKAIVDVGRTFEAASGSFSIFGKTYDWFKDSSKTLVIELPPALPSPNVVPPKATKIDFLWKTSEGQTSDQPSFVAIFKKSGTALVELTNNLDFGIDGKKVFTKKPLPEVNLKKLTDLVAARVDPASFTLTIGETQELTFVIEPIETQPPPIPTPAPTQTPNPAVPASSKNDVFYLLDKEYVLTLPKVDWVENPTLSKKGIESNPYNFVAEDIGVINGLARGNLLLSETFNKSKTITDVQLDARWSAQRQSPQIEFLVNDKPIDSEPHYLGQKITVSIQGLTTQNHYVPIKKYSWKIEEPVVGGFETDTDQKWGHAFSGKVLNNQPAEFVIYNYDRTKTSKELAITYEYWGHTFQATSLLVYLRPEMIEDKYRFTQPIPNIFVSTTSSGEKYSRIGYDVTIKDNCHRGHLAIKNWTGVEYTVYFVQLVKSGDIREFENGEINFVDMPTKWLDGGFPYLFPNIIKLEMPGYSLISNFENFTDYPTSPFKDNIIQTEPLKYHAQSDFSVFIMVSPTIKDSIKVPIYYYEWSWWADATRTGNDWTKGSFYPKELLDEQPIETPLVTLIDKYPFGFPKWENKFGFGEVPPWKSWNPR